MKGLLANMWDNKKSVVGGVFDIVANKKEAKHKKNSTLRLGIVEVIEGRYSCTDPERWICE